MGSAWENLQRSLCGFYISSPLKGKPRRSGHGSVVMNPTSSHEDAGSILGLALWVKDLALLWLWCRQAGAVPIQPLAWELPHATGSALNHPAPKKEESQTNLKVAGLESVSKNQNSLPSENESVRAFSYMASSCHWPDVLPGAGGIHPRAGRTP